MVDEMRAARSVLESLARPWTADKADFAVWCQNHSRKQGPAAWLDYFAERAEATLGAIERTATPPADERGERERQVIAAAREWLAAHRQEHAPNNPNAKFDVVAATLTLIVAIQGLDARPGQDDPDLAGILRRLLTDWDGLSGDSSRCYYCGADWTAGPYIHAPDCPIPAGRRAVGMDADARPGGA